MNEERNETRENSPDRPFFEKEEGGDGGHPHGDHGHGPHGHGPHGCSPRGQKPPLPPFLQEEENELPALLLRAGHHLLHRLGPRGKGQNRILRILAERGPISQKELTDLLQIQPGSMSEILAKLENRGLLTREKDPQDRRRIIVTLTREGQEKLQGPEESWNAKEAFSCLTGDEQEELTRLLARLLESWKLRE